MTTLFPFAHRKNPDASIDSICTACFLTVASEFREDNLIAHEERHVCDPYWHISRNPVIGESTFAPTSVSGRGGLHGFQVQ